MDSFNDKVSKLDTLLAMGHITQAEHARRKQQFVDEFLNAGSRPTSAARPSPRHSAGFPRQAAFSPFGGMGGFGAMPYGAFGQSFGGFPRGGMGGAMRGFAARGLRFDPYRDPSTRGPTTAVKVQPIPEGITAEDVKAHFLAYGTVTTAVIKEGVPRHAYVNYATPEEANLAASAGRVTLGGYPCTVGLSWRSRPAVLEGAPTNGIGIFNIPFHLTYDEIVAMLSAYPGFQTLKMVTSKMGEFRGYVFAYFDTVENAAYAKSNILGLQLGEQTLDCKFSNRPAEEVLAQA